MVVGTFAFETVLYGNFCVLYYSTRVVRDFFPSLPPPVTRLSLPSCFPAGTTACRTNGRQKRYCRELARSTLSSDRADFFCRCGLLHRNYCYLRSLSSPSP
ncbi:hypothetical protein ZHAS_00021963 [Anopheles sinensis]|uniref:Uncharacterized protein n=1 Tax=Anopheles sinensis TaxID=74873 RepID=A0A084WTB3_ANOSI|nr:hypothetical protein ZHAS_00021963 [Anopheles sinensis]